MKVLPTLTFFGFTDDPNFVVRKLYEYFVLSYYSQSILSSEKISSLDYVLKISDNDPKKTVESMTVALENLYGKYFKEYKVDIDVKAVKISEFKTIQKCVINVTVIENGEKFYLNKDFNVEEDKITGLENSLDYILNKSQDKRI